MLRNSEVPWSNGIAERLHAVTGKMFDKLKLDTDNIYL